MPSSSIVLDTHVLLWHLGDRGRLSAAAKRAISSAKELRISAISFWEISMLVAKGRVALDRPMAEWTNDVVATEGIVEVPLVAHVAVAAGELTDFHGDPADRFIVAAAIANNCPVISKDRLVRQWATRTGQVQCVW